MCQCLKKTCRCLCDCAIGILRIFIFIFNVVFWVAGAALITVSALLIVRGPGNDYEAIIEGASDEMWKISIILMMGVGILMFLAGFLGCCGSMKNSASALCWYSILMIIVFAIQCTIGIFVAKQMEEVDNHLGEQMLDQVQNNYTGEDDSMTEAWDAMQENCCGADNYLDWFGSYYQESKGFAVPKSCCHDSSTNDSYSECLDEAVNVTSIDDHTYIYLYPEGCYKKMSDWMSGLTLIIFVVVYIIALLELVCIIIACCACCTIKKEDNKVDVY